MIGYAAASQSAQQVTAMLGGPPASDRRVQDQLNELLASKSRPELWEVLRLLKEFLGGDRQAASQYFSERPGLTKAVFQAQVLLGESGEKGRGLRSILSTVHGSAGLCSIGDCVGEVGLGVLAGTVCRKLVVMWGSHMQAVEAVLWMWYHVNSRSLTSSSHTLKLPGNASL
jgi:hypothetical protein